VCETWFFRDPASFDAFTQAALEWLGRNPAGTLRILSVPCSTGEEPCSLAMRLLDSKVPPHRFVIDAVDVSGRSLARAQRALYGKNSFRGGDLSFRDRHFRETAEGFELSDTVRKCVRFHQDNVLAETFLAGHEPYQIIFCRNLLIYFDSA